MQLQNHDSIDQEILLETLLAIHNRHSIGKVRPDPVPQALLEQLLDCAAQSPNHHHNQSWHFVVLSAATILPARRSRTGIRQSNPNTRNKRNVVSSWGY